MLTTGIDNITGTSGNDTFDASQNATGPTDTLNSLDSLDGGAGNDTLKVVETSEIDTTALAGVTIKNIETANLTTTSTVTANTTTWAGLTALNTVSADDVVVTAAATTDVVVAASALSGAAGNEVTIDGGKNVTVTSADGQALGTANATNISIGATTAAAGAVVVTHTDTVAVTADAGATASAGTETTVTGGATVTVNSLATVGTGDNAGDIFTQGAVIVNGNASTTAVTVKQSAATATWATAGDKAKIVNGGVTVEDKNAATASDTITTVTLENFGASEIKSTVLSTLNLTAGATIAGGAVTLTQTAADKSTAATTLALNTSGSFGNISGTQADVYKTVNVTAAAATTIADIEMDALTTLNVAGTGVTTFTALTAAQNAKLATIASTGGGLTIGTELATGVAVTGGAGVESILIGATTKTIDLGAGNDVVTVSTTTMGAGGAVKGGDGTDTLVANTNGSAFAGLPAFTGFETLRIAGTAAEGAHNAVGFTALELGATKAAVSSFTNVAAGVGLTVLAAPGGAHTVTLADATGKADSFKLTFKSAGALDLSTNGITLAGVETINITNTDTNTTAHTNKLNLTADSVTSIVVTGNAGLDLTGSTYAKVTSFDASGITGAAADAAALAVTYVSGNTTVAENVTIRGGSGTGAKLYDEAFAEFANRADLPDFDYIGLHGIWSWISDENRQVIVDFIRKKLKVGGVLYISYNTLPGWASFAPMRHLMTEHAEVLGSEGRGIVSRIDGALDFAEKLLATNPLYLKANPLVSERLSKMKDGNRHYIAHEYFNRDWHPMHFATMAKWLEVAKLQYACSAHYLDHVDVVNLTSEQKTFLAEIPDPMYRQSVRDFMVNQQFRKDYWVKGARQLTVLEQAERLRELRVVLISHRPDVSLKVNGALGEAEMSDQIYGPILDFLADHKPKTIEQIDQAVAEQGIVFSQVVQSIMVLAGAGHLVLAQDEAVIGKAKKTTDKLNAQLLKKARGSSDVAYLASPVSGGGYPVNRFQQLFLLAKQQGHKHPQDWANFVWNILALQNQRLVKDGKTLETVEENLAELTAQASEFAEKQLPILKALQIA